MKTLVIIAMLVLGFTTGSSARAIEVVNGNAAVSPLPDDIALPSQTISRSVRLPELPEPDVVAMMLVGLVLIGYRASRDSDEKFT